MKLTLELLGAVASLIFFIYMLETFLNNETCVDFGIGLSLAALYILGSKKLRFISERR